MAPGQTRRRRVLLTGAAGLIGGVLRAGLGDEHDLVGVDRRRGPGVDHVRDLARGRRLERVFEGIDAVIDLAARASLDTSWRDVSRANIPATINVLEHARRAGVRRVVFASSNHVTGMAEHDEPYASVLAGRLDGLDPTTIPRLDHTAPIRPDGPYGVGKAFGEAACRHASEAHGISTICLRIGTVRASDAPASTRHLATLLTHRDLVSLVRCCVEAPDELRFGVYYGTSANTWRIWDLEPARRELGYAPADDAERWRPELAGS